MWVTDQVINFFYEVLGESYKDIPKIRLIDPASVSCIYHMTEIDDLFEVFGPLRLHKADMIICPVNDNTSPLETGGTHWALLVYIRVTDTFHYFDSAGEEIPTRLSVASKLRALISNRKESYYMRELSSEVETFRYTPRQGNSYDCGIFVMGITLCLLNLYKTCPSELRYITSLDFEQYINQDEADDMRQYIRNMLLFSL
ncbi:unnamed protein product [Moneuplotes crassus]|uniref:Ubiquitin-like protease family profile domain-containing protein n=1 Tax=Euplotes crassus TaxID=5936 RepID=A0AAD1XSG1_EUPCR|nr:unnamed protein product [Moneuplotes crassus]